MKRLLILLVAMVLPLAPIAAQDSTITVPVSVLSRHQLDSINHANLNTRLVQGASQWIGLGREVGEAVNSGVTALTDQAAKFADTRAGKWTIAIIVWRVVGAQLMGYVAHIGIGLFIFVIGSVAILWSYRRTCMSRQVLVKVAYDERGKKIKEYKTLDPEGQTEEIDGRRFVHAAFAIGLILITAVIVLSF